MKKLLLVMALIGAGMVSGCAPDKPPIITVTKYEIVVPPASLMRCGAEKVPQSFTSNKEVAESYLKLWKHNQFCHNNMEATKKFLDDAKKEIDDKDTAPTP